MTTELATLPPQETAIQVFSAPSGLDPYIEQIRKEVMSHAPDTSTKKGRDHIASLAFKVRKSKTALDGMGKQLVDDLKDVPKKIDAERKRMRDAMDALANEVRKPLDAWEAAEDDRVKKHKAGIDWFVLRATENRDLDANELRLTLDGVSNTLIDESWQEFEAEAHRAKANAIESLKAALVERERKDAEHAELERLREEKAARDKKDEEERIAREAADRATREAEAKAQAEREAVAKREAEAKAAAERRELELKLQAEQAEKAAAKAEADRLAAEARAEAEKMAAEQRAKDAAEAARQAEIKRMADELEAAKAEQKRREEDKAHRKAINNAALMAFVENGLTEDQAKLTITAIAKGAIPAIKIHY